MSLSNLFGGDDDGAQDYLKQALAQYQNVTVPTTESEKVSNLPQETVQGTVNPNEIKVDQQDPTAYNNIALDPQTRQAQLNALNGYQDIANSGGLDANAKLGIQQAVDAANIQSQGDQGAIMKAAQAMGQGGGDFALTQRAIASQGASNNVANQGLQEAAEAEANRENALSQMSNIGGSVNASDFNQAAAKANAQDVINASNTGAKNAANTNNVSNQLNAGEFNVNNAQGVNSRNTAANQNNAYYNAGLPQQQFNNELAKASGMSGVNQQQANLAQTQSQNGANTTGQLLKGGLTLGATALGGPIAGALTGTAVSNGQGFSAIPHAPPTSANTQQYAPQGPGQSLNYSEGGAVCMAQGGEVHNHYMCMLMGGPVPGKAPVKGDSPENDIVPAKLSPGEIVIKRSKASNPDEAAKEAKKISLEHFSKGYKKGKK